MDYDHLFDQQISQLKEEGNYRIFAELERCQGNFPRAKNYQSSKKVSEVTVWCSNDYLGMGQNPEVLSSIETAYGKVAPELEGPEIFLVRTIIIFF